ncbi:MAG: Cystine-binding periplasmic protein precursor [Deltaproteobacteria bacterium ADurb.BinA179]|jgi:polar amino acid transport system substrate-binding protein|nr:amino acid ABC transporter substrate-binding protein [Bacteriovoracaceae bacterium]OPZ26020.1 MAG: Cystine-binding periplasmic protein precursor [Deltaproteobacteria bacterium ADurb.BinA179]HNR51584.1 amino acid ABC transporter substrate-binding protein [Deltaproteobacteria bacterium]HRR21214.1 amino acid ABC transporter substrate-binding protein [Desulfomonilia bacterium]HNU74632.1 amino acid ABC transporter substrate-binding protein [Deltaproteobacteria bacterium]
MKKLSYAIGLVGMIVAFFSAPGVAADDSWERVKAAGKLVIGIDDAFPPMEFRNEQNELVGFDIDASRELGKRLGIEIVHVPTAWKGVIMSLKTKKFDIIWSGMSITEERMKEIAFTKPYIMEKQIMVVKGDNQTIKSVKDLGNKHVAGVQLGSTSEEAMKKLGTEFKEVKRYDNNTSAFMDLKIGRIDVLAVDELVGRYYLSQRPGEYRVLPEPLTSEPIGIGIRQEDVALKDMIQKTLDEMFADGTMKKISIKWFGDDITSWK